MTNETKTKIISHEMYDWIKKTKPYHLILGEVLKLEIGDIVEVAMFDSNFEEYDIWNNIKPGEILPAPMFFKHNKSTLIYKGNLVWDIEYDFGETIEHPVHICTEGINSKSYFTKSENGNIKIKSEAFTNGEKKYQIINCKNLSSQTRVGWRGPMIKWEHLSHLPPVYWNGGNNEQPTE